jgi:hypothetical protein
MNVKGRSMSAKRKLARRKQAANSGILLRYRNKDTAEGITRKTAMQLAAALGLSETQLVHVALANLARKTLSGYEADDGPVMPQQMDEIRRLVAQRGFVSGKKRLF